MIRNMEKYRLHTGWTFCLDERNEKDETAPSEGFRAVTLPHDWSTDYPFDPESDTCGSGGYAKAGIGWYQSTITISEVDIKNRQIILYFLLLCFSKEKSLPSCHLFSNLTDSVPSVFHAALFLSVFHAAFVQLYCNSLFLFLQLTITVSSQAMYYTET